MWFLIMVLIYIPLMTNNVKHVFSFQLWHFKKCNKAFFIEVYVSEKLHRFKAYNLIISIMRRCYYLLSWLKDGSILLSSTYYLNKEI